MHRMDTNGHLPLESVSRDLQSSKRQKGLHCSITWNMA
jgi:hypothetical protein